MASCKNLNVLFAMFLVVLCVTSQYAHGQNDGSASELPSEEIEFDEYSNVAVVHSNQGESSESIVAIDYDKSLLGFYDARTSSCYILGGIPSGMPDGQTLQKNSEGESTTDDETYEFEVATDQEIVNHNILPQQLREECRNLPLQWIQPTDDKIERQKRRCVEKDGFVIKCHANGKCWKKTVTRKCPWTPHRASARSTNDKDNE